MLSHRLTRRTLIELSRPRPYRSFLVHEPCIVSQSLRSFAGLANPYNPRTRLQEWYQDNHGKKISNEDSFQFDDHFHNGKVWWTARFVCPLTLRIYDGGQSSDINLTNDPLALEGDDSSSICIGNKIFYAKLKTAIQAAASKRLEEISSELNDGYTFEVSEATSTTQTPEEFIPVNDIVPNVSLTDEENIPQTIVEPAPPTGKRPAISVSMTPLHLLSMYYDKKQIQFNREKFETKAHQIGENAAFWSATFFCPVSGKKYRSGLLRDADNYAKVSIVKGKPVYGRIKAALHAAAAVALDDLLSPNANDTLTIPVPSDDDASPSHSAPVAEQLMDHDRLPITTNASIVSQMDEPAPRATDVEFSQKPVITPVIVPAYPSMNTLDRVLLAWVNNIEKGVALEPGPRAMVSSTWHHLQERRKICQEAASWLASTGTISEPSQKRALPNKIQMNHVESYNALLRALGKANDIKNGLDVKSYADSLLQSLWNTCRPNAGTYAAYFRCLHGEPANVAREAEDILRAMITGDLVDQKTLPLPTVDVFNTVIQMWVSAGDIQSCERIWDLMISSGFEANRKTIYLMLLSQSLGKFDPVVSKTYLDQGKSMSTDPVDSDMYCAPLRWSGKRVGTKTLSWDNFSKIYSDGFHEQAIEGTYQEAEALESWVSGMKDVVKVTTGCYEAIIQAWARSGSFEGILRAEEVGQRLLAGESENESLQPRLQTFFPILAAWAASEDNLSNFKRWIHRLQSHGIIQGDTRVASMHICACTRRAEALFQSDSQSDFAEGMLITKEALDELSRLCEQVDEYYSDAGDFPTFLDTSVFCNVISGIGFSGKHQLRNANYSDGKAAVEAILHTVTLFQNMMKSLLALSKRNHVDERLKFEFFEKNDASEPHAQLVEMQLQHLVGNAAGVFRCAISSLNDIVSTVPRNHDGGDCDQALVSIIPDVECALRYSIELSHLRKSFVQNESIKDFLYPDGFSFYDDSTYMATQLEVYSSAVDFMKNPTGDQKFLNTARIIAIIVDEIFEYELAEESAPQILVLVHDAMKLLYSLKQTRAEEAVFGHFLADISRKSNGYVVISPTSILERTNLATSATTEPSVQVAHARSTSTKKTAAKPKLAISSSKKPAVIAKAKTKAKNAKAKHAKATNRSSPAKASQRSLPAKAEDGPLQRKREKKRRSQ